MSPQEALLKIKAMFAEATIEPSVDAPSGFDPYGMMGFYGM